ncbi:MAG: LiaI-LiaF-like domain-containing protein [Patescibacteria group bacterium]|jgi:hypothetical protein
MEETIKSTSSNSQKEQGSRERSEGGGLAAATLIFLGVIFLLNNLGFLPWSVWEQLWRFWPLILVFAGLEILLGKSRVSRWFIFIISLIVFLVLLVIVAAPINSRLSRFAERYLGKVYVQSQKALNKKHRQIKTLKVSETNYLNSSTKSRDIFINFGIGKLELIDSNSRDFFEVTATYYPGFGEPTLDQTFAGSNLQINLDTIQNTGMFPTDQEIHYDAVIGRSELPTTVSLKLGAGKAEIYLDQTSMRKIGIDVGAGSADITLTRESLPNEISTVEVGVGSVFLSVPQNTALKVHHDVGIGRLEIENNQLQGKGTYITPGYESTVEKMELSVKVEVGSVKIKQV